MKSNAPDRPNVPRSRTYDAVVVGAGWAGLYLLHRLRKLGLEVLVLEAGDGIGGTWYWNRYPGARCDVESWDYSYSFDPDLEQDWEWSERFAAQPEILSYLEHVADRYDLWSDIQLSSRVESAVYDDAAAGWSVTIEDGDTLRAQFLLFATGCLSAAQVPDIPGRAEFEGNQFHTGEWPHEGVDFSGQRVGVIGTGSSGVQAIPLIAEQADHLTVFQRTPTFSVPARNRPIGREERSSVKANYRTRRQQAQKHPGGLPITIREESALEVGDEERREQFERRWQTGGPGLPGAFRDVPVDPIANEYAADFVREKIQETVEDPRTADLLTPRGFPFGAKRPCLDTGYYETYNRSDVELVDVNQSPIERITRDGVQTGDGLIELDSIVFATGYDAMTGALNRIDIRGRGGELLREKWDAGPVTYLGLSSAGFPNMFVVAGPGSPSVLGNVIVTIEHHVDWLGELLDYLRTNGFTTIETTPEAERAWVEHVNELASQTLFLKANSWYLGANIPGKPRVFMPYPGGIGPYQETCAAVAEKGYEGFVLNRSSSADADHSGDT